MTLTERACPDCGLRFLRLETHMHVHVANVDQRLSLRPRITKEEAPCCQARVDEIGRPPIGFCSPECVRRPRRDDG